MFKNRNIVYLFSFVVVVTLSFFAFSSAQAKDAIKFGFPAPLSGSSAGWGESMLRGTTLAIEDLNSQGGILGHPVELIKGDVEGQEPSTVISVVRKLINRDKVNIMVAGGVNPSCVEYPIMQQSKMPYLLFAYSQSHERIWKEKPGEYDYVHNCTTTYQPYKEEFANIVRELEKEGKFKPINRKLAVIKSQNAYSIYCGDGLKETFKSRGWEIVIDETIPYGGRFTEFTPILSKIRKLVPAIVLYTDHTSANAASFLLDFIQDPTPSLVYLQATPSYPDFKKIMNGRQEGVFWTYPDPLLGPKGEDFAEKFQKRWNKRPAPYGVFNYDVVMIAADAMKKAGNPFDREAVNKVLNAPDYSYDGVGGTYKFDSSTHLAKYGAGLIEFATKQEWGGSSTVFIPAKYKNGDFHIPPWYEKGLKKYGN